jgi:hypothetical protein
MRCDERWPSIVTRQVEGEEGTYETLSTVHGDGSDGVLSEMLGDLEDKSSSLEVLDLEGVEDRGKIL